MTGRTSYCESVRPRKREVRRDSNRGEDTVCSKAMRYHVCPPEPQFGETMGVSLLGLPKAPTRPRPVLLVVRGGLGDRSAIQVARMTSYAICLCIGSSDRTGQRFCWKRVFRTACLRGRNARVRRTGARGPAALWRPIRISRHPSGNAHCITLALRRPCAQRPRTAIHGRLCKCTSVNL